MAGPLVRDLFQYAAALRTHDLSDEEILAYVAEKEGAIGYMSIDTPLPEGVKTVSIVD